MMKKTVSKKMPAIDVDFINSGQLRKALSISNSRYAIFEVSIFHDLHIETSFILSFEIVLNPYLA